MRLGKKSNKKPLKLKYSCKKTGNNYRKKSKKVKKMKLFKLKGGDPILYKIKDDEFGNFIKFLFSLNPPILFYRYNHMCELFRGILIEHHDMKYCFNKNTLLLKIDNTGDDETNNDNIYSAEWFVNLQGSSEQTPLDDYVIQSLIKDCAKTLFTLPIHYAYSSDEGHLAHAMVAIANSNQKTVELFNLNTLSDRKETNSVEALSKNTSKYKSLHYEIIEKLRQLFEGYSIKLSALTNSCEATSLSRLLPKKSVHRGGLCQLLSLWFANLRYSFPDKNDAELTIEIKHVIDKFILKEELNKKNLHNVARLLLGTEIEDFLNDFLINIVRRLKFTLTVKKSADYELPIHITITFENTNNQSAELSDMYNVSDFTPSDVNDPYYKIKSAISNLEDGSQYIFEHEAEIKTDKIKPFFRDLFPE